MPSQKQLDANRRNAQKSAGARTPEGRAALRHNAVTQGLTAEGLLLDPEDEDAFNQLSEAFQDEYQPRTPTEHTLLEQLVCAAWRLRRVRAIEQGIFDDRLSQTAEYLEEIHQDPTDSVRLGHVFRQDSSGPHALVNLRATKPASNARFTKALHELQRSRDRRDKQDLQKQTQLASARVPSAPASLAADTPARRVALDMHRRESPQRPIPVSEIDPGLGKLEQISNRAVRKE
ncbi:MAG: hypothetical protein ACR2I2_00880 [Bryobacteraceae bacterium]